MAVSLMTAAGAAAQHEPYHGDGIDDYLRFVPIVSAYALKAAGVDSRSQFPSAKGKNFRFKYLGLWK